jgi:hypothetical protein
VIGVRTLISHGEQYCQRGQVQSGVHMHEACCVQLDHDHARYGQGAQTSRHDGGSGGNTAAMPGSVAVARRCMQGGMRRMVLQLQEPTDGSSCHKLINVAWRASYNSGGLVGWCSVSRTEAKNELEKKRGIAGNANSQWQSCSSQSSTDTQAVVRLNTAVGGGGRRSKVCACVYFGFRSTRIIESPRRNILLQQRGAWQGCFRVRGQQPCRGHSGQTCN